MFNPQKPYGKFCPPWKGVAFEQDGHYYDSKHNEVTADGEPVLNGKIGVIEEETPAEAPVPPKSKNGDSGELYIDITDLLERKNMPFMAFKKAARQHLGDSTPTLKADIIRALEAKAAAAQTPPPPPPNGGPTHNKENPKPHVAPNGVDLVAWMDKRVGKQYLMGDVFAAIQVLYHRKVSNERDAVNFLIDEGVVPAEYARNAGAGLSWGDMEGERPG